MDVFNQYATFTVLQQCGFYLPAPPYLSPIVNDKLATLLHLADSPIPPVPTVRIGTGRDLVLKLYEPALRQLTFPAIVKPATGWGSAGRTPIQPRNETNGKPRNRAPGYWGPPLWLGR